MYKKTLGTNIIYLIIKGIVKMMLHQSKFLLLRKIIVNYCVVLSLVHKSFYKYGYFVLNIIFVKFKLYSLNLKAVLVQHALLISLTVDLNTY